MILHHLSIRLKQKNSKKKEKKSIYLKIHQEALVMVRWFNKEKDHNSDRYYQKIEIPHRQALRLYKPLKQELQRKTI
jgi:hypothetical protein